ncbi:hypothetical protein SERLA73DRAFT_71725 [Serpula lacrymans var. lacrymans S7.3]|uniref:Terpene synthase n=2 Tax=Serpula lacrymans var. lacrymans TaxID=341189 RepID=F8PSD0_SERL3|nr:uncharacterized protein SERLADRAFT_436128 [Serpula lacrymans var. lacrymans S7.9]EGO00743.1 hypothetical protein SERLA73DRAFT_71725 [Serpula lacrymans var. lacrymans S7.3]EGO26308.1 hypothetical protein SERLADRAFT_436128 [Serpula lacrymans var. lacrymans S7.9]
MAAILASSESQTPLHPSGLAASYFPRLQLFLGEIGYRHGAPPHPNLVFLQSFHEWFHSTLGPILGWNAEKLDNIECATASFGERAYPFTGTEMCLLIAKMTATAMAIDDLVDDDNFYAEMLRFTHRIYVGEAQPHALLTIHQELIKEMANAYTSTSDGDAILTGIAAASWTGFIDGCLVEKRMMRGVKPEAVSSHYQCFPERSDDLKHVHIEQNQVPFLMEGSAIEFPAYLRSKTGAGEAYAVAVFKAKRCQILPLEKVLKALPDIALFICFTNDIMSFHKEQLAGERCNTIHLRTRAIQSASSHNDGGSSGTWSLMDTFNLVCNEVRDATLRVDALLRVEEIERSINQKGVRGTYSDMDIALAKQWREFRDGYISWHLESRRYKLECLRPSDFYQQA